MKRYLTSTYVFLAVMLSHISACTNGGDIGPLYGEWALTSYTIDGSNADIDLGQYFWQFQSDLVCIVKTLPHNDFLYSFGTWQKSSDRLSLNFTHSADDEIPESSAYNPPPELGIPVRAVTEFTITLLTGEDMHLSFVDHSGVKRAYRLKKVR